MKYFMKAMKESKVLAYDIVYMLIKLVSTVINAQILIYISEVFINYEDPIEPILKILVACVINTVLETFINWLGCTAKHTLYASLIKMYTRKIVDADYEMFVKHSVGSIIATGHGGIMSITRLSKEVIEIVSAIMRFVVTAVAIILLSPTAALPIIIIYGIVGYVLFRLNIKWRILDHQVDELRRKKVTIIEETVSGFAELRSFQDANKRQYNYIIDNIILTGRILADRNKLSRCITASALGADTLFMMVIIFVSLYGMRSGFIVGSTAVVLVTYAWRLIEPLDTMISYMAIVSEDMAPLPRFKEVMDYVNTVSVGELTFKGLENEITFERVGFKYNDSDNVLDDTTFTIKKGEHIGICGPSGGGKSTLLKLIPKFYDVTEGAIKFDGVDIKHYTQDSIRAKIGIVHQDPFIFDDTIGNNIRFARKDKNATEGELREACKRANIYDFIMSLPDKFDTQVGPKGLKLSGGQKQRIALARLFISDPEIVILDEATSALDTETERAVQKAIDTLECTVIVVAHRLSTIKKSDKIIVIDNHHVAEEGTHEELLEQGGLYAHLVKLAAQEEE